MILLVLVKNLKKEQVIPLYYTAKLFFKAYEPLGLY